MGMDVFGRRPARQAGEYFRANVWCWHPLADMCNDLAPQICAACEDWHSNGGDGLDNRSSKALAKVLRTRLADGTVSAYIEARDKSLAALPDEACGSCGGTGKAPTMAAPQGRRPEDIFLDFINVEQSRQTGCCSRCNGSGKRRPMECNYGFDLEDVKAFADFLDACGGFEIC